jgi:saccharopine dehydrogenase (NADP+, L-glutamate forming)
MGLDPGIDHMSAMKLLDHLKGIGGQVFSFKSHCGGLVAPVSDDNPWHYKISWNSANVVKAGSAGAVYLENGVKTKQSYEQLFEDCGTVALPSLGDLAYYPNRDSLHYIPIYKLSGVKTFIRTTLRHPSFCNGWLAIVKAGLTDDTKPLNTSGATFQEWSSPINAYVNTSNKHQLEFLGLFDDVNIPPLLKNNAEVLQFLLDTRLKLRTGDKDMVVMKHEIGYTVDQKDYQLYSHLIVEGDDDLRTAMAKTVGLPLGIAASLVLQGKIKLTGLHIPTPAEIYEPVLDELLKEGIRFIDVVV